MKKFSLNIIIIIFLFFFQKTFYVHANTFKIDKDQRLSDFIKSKNFSKNEYISALSWYNSDEITVQRKLKHDLLIQLLKKNTVINDKKVQNFITFLSEVNPTGRTIIKNTDPFWLEVNERYDPIIKAGDKIRIPKKTNEVLVLNPDLSLCRSSLKKGFYILDYLQSCFKKSNKIDEVFLIQPDGNYFNIKIAKWNEESQVNVVDGSIIISFTKNSIFPKYIFNDIAKFFSYSSPFFLTGENINKTIIGKEIQSVGKTNLFSSLKVTPSDWGVSGLMQVPSARFAPEGRVTLQLNSIYPYVRYNLIFSPFDWFEGGFRYVSVRNRLYGDRALSGDQSYKDKSFEAKLRLTKESRYFPQVAIGLRDFAGSGLFSGEYLVASKRYGNFDGTIGVGWGNVGGRQDMSNPFSFIDSDFNSRYCETNSTGGQINHCRWFRGRSSLIGGIQYQTPISELILKLELDGNDYKTEDSQDDFIVKSKYNYGLVYQLTETFDINLAWQRGNKFMLGITAKPEINKSIPKVLDSKKLSPEIDLYSTRNKLFNSKLIEDQIFNQVNWRISGISVKHSVLTLYVDDAKSFYWEDKVDRVISVLNKYSNPKIYKFVIVFVQKGLRVAQNEVDRKKWIKVNSQPISISNRSNYVFKKKPNQFIDDLDFKAKKKIVDADITTNYQQTLGGPDGFILAQLGIKGRAKIRLRDKTWIVGATKLGLIDNYDKYRQKGSSNLPRVRTYLREYVTEPTISIPYLQIFNLGKLSDKIFYSSYAGLFEYMFGGIGGEVMYKPWNSNFSYSLDINRVRQRGFRSNFEFRDYSITTGHLNIFWDTGLQGLNINLAAGQYLAGDVGMTLNLMKKFSNGSTMGAWVTRTNVSAEQFGEGSFDKGIYFSVPFDVFIPKSTEGVGRFSWRPLTRDGGAILQRPTNLHSITKLRSRGY